MKMNRREFGGAIAGAALAIGIGSELNGENERLPANSSQESIPLGYDNFSIRALNWKADQHLDFAIKQKLDAILFSDLDVYENHDKKYLNELATKAKDNGITLQAGTGGICPTSNRFDKKWGTAQEHLELNLAVAKGLNANVVRCYLGHANDRKGEGGIQRHIDATVAALQSVKQQAIDADVKFAVENHAGDMQARELVGLIEAAGTDFVGVTLDSGNATWTLENPQNNLEILGPHALSSGIRDSTVWEVDQGAKVAWNAIGEGQVDWKKFTQRFAELCPNVPFQLEIISGFSKLFAYQSDDFWNVFPDARAKDFEAFLQMARAGKAIPDGKAGDPEFQMAELKRCFDYCKNELGLGRKK